MNKVGKIHIYSIYMIKFINKIKHYVYIYIYIYIFDMSTQEGEGEYIYIYIYLTCPHKREEEIRISDIRFIRCGPRATS
jgi:hypothetical protein